MTKFKKMIRFPYLTAFLLIFGCGEGIIDDNQPENKNVVDNHLIGIWENTDNTFSVQHFEGGSWNIIDFDRTSPTIQWNDYQFYDETYRYGHLDGRYISGSYHINEDTIIFSREPDKRIFELSDKNTKLKLHMDFYFSDLTHKGNTYDSAKIVTSNFYELKK